MPLARATRVAAGIPMTVTVAAATIVTRVSAAGGIQRAKITHRITVAADPHVPGPGFMRPAPKKVAISVAHSGASERVAVGPGDSAQTVIMARTRSERGENEVDYSSSVSGRSSAKSSVSCNGDEIT